MDPTAAASGFNMLSLSAFMPILTILGAGAFIWYNNIKSKDSEVANSAHAVENQASVDKIESIHSEAVKVVAEIKDLDKKSVDKQIEMQTVINNANKQIEALNNANSIEEINKIMGR